MAVTSGAGIGSTPFGADELPRVRDPGADGGLIGTAEHGVLGRRWIYDGTHDPVLIAQLVALIQGEAEPQAQSVSNTPDPTVTVMPGSAAT